MKMWVQEQTPENAGLATKKTRDEGAPGRGIHREEESDCQAGVRIPSTNVNKPGMAVLCADGRADRKMLGACRSVTKAKNAGFSETPS